MAFKDLYVWHIWERSILWVKIIIICPGFQCYQIHNRRILTFFGQVSGVSPSAPVNLG